MLTFSLLLLVALLVALLMAPASASAVQLTEMESALAARADFVRGQLANASQLHEVVFALKQRNMVQIDRILLEVSDPQHANYGRYLTRAQVGELTVDHEAVAAITAHLINHGAQVTRASPYGEYIAATAPISTWQALLHTEFYDFVHVAGTKPTVQRCLRYALPAELAVLVDTVFYTVQLPPRSAIRTAVHGHLRGQQATGSITPAVLNAFYHISNNTGSPLASQAVFETLEQFFSPNDLTLFQNMFHLPLQQPARVIGGFRSDGRCMVDPDNCIEGNLDLQYLMAVAQGVPTTYFYDGAPDPFLHWIEVISHMSNPPLVHSMSYGSVEQENSPSTLTAFNNEAKKLGVQGVTIVISSGDDGVANFKARDDAQFCGYNPSFPASSPFVLAVGATQGPESGSTEIACASDTGGVITTGGGFSTFYISPEYQKTAVDGYFAHLSSSNAPVQGFDRTGRAYPDVALAGLHYEVVVGGNVLLVSGTSASAPAVAGMISLVNSARLDAGKSSLGFVNPAIYLHGTAITNDITSGKNNCAAQNIPQVCCAEGFFAAAGWDPLTGFGSLDFQKFHDVFVNL